MNKVLISVKPVYAKAIMDLEKKYEFRRRIPKIAQEHGTKIVLYATKPEASIVGECIVKQAFWADPYSLWSQFGKNTPGETEQDFMKYFLGLEKGWCLELSTPLRYDIPIPLESMRALGITPPMSPVPLSDHNYHQILAFLGHNA